MTVLTATAMIETTHPAWRCPLCDRQMPAAADMCRCGFRPGTDAPTQAHHVPAGSGRRPGSVVTLPPPPPLPIRMLLRLVGHRPVPAVPIAWRAVLGAMLVIVLAVLFTRTFAASRHLPPHTAGHIRVIARLEDVARDADPSVANSVVDFLGMRGMLGILNPNAPPDREVKRLGSGDLAHAVCSRTLARLIRHEFPGFYEGWPDVQLERAVLAKYPEYRDRICVIPSWIDAVPADIIKYEVEPPSLLAWYVLPGARALLVTLVAAWIGCTLYFRVIAARLGSE